MPHLPDPAWSHHFLKAALLSAAQAVEDALDSMPALEGSAANVRPDDISGGSMADAVHGVHPDVKAEGTAGSAAVAGPAAKAESSEPEAERGGKVSRRQPVLSLTSRQRTRRQTMPEGAAGAPLAQRCMLSALPCSSMQRSLRASMLDVDTQCPLPG